MLTKQDRTKLVQQAEALVDLLVTAQEDAMTDDAVSPAAYSRLMELKDRAWTRMWRREALPLDRGKLDTYAWPGGYPIYYYTKDGAMLCAECASSDEDDSTGDVYWEGPTLQCENCNKELESAYGDPDADDDE